MSTASPRDIIEALARGLAEKRYFGRWDDLKPFTRAAHRTLGLTIIRILTAAGYRVVREGELDAATVERCANHLDVLAEAHHDRAAYRTKGGKYHTLFTERGEGLSEGADALRALAEAKP